MNGRESDTEEGVHAAVGQQQSVDESDEDAACGGGE